jgi:hypothetical protein
MRTHLSHLHTTTSKHAPCVCVGGGGVCLWLWLWLGLFVGVCEGAGEAGSHDGATALRYSVYLLF